MRFNPLEIQKSQNNDQIERNGECGALSHDLAQCIAEPCHDPVAIIGIAFRFPGDIGDESSFWNALRLKHDLITRVPSDRWAVDELRHVKRSEPGRSITFSAGVLSRIDEFDAAFFGISPREAAWLDPQQRLLLELAWEAMENAGIPPSSMAGTDCAVYVGISSLDYGTRGLDDLASMSPHSMTGNTLSIAANRLSYVFDLHGPSLAVDTACSSSLVALHHACHSLRTGEASAALVGGVNLLLHPYPFVGFTKASMLSADGRCKVFDASGDGYVRSEGAAVLLLKPLDKALADGDDIQAVILATGVNADGARKTGITIPSSEGQAELMREVLARSGLSAQDVDFIEAHGTGTVVGDPIEAHAIGTVYGQGRTQPLPIGSVKANLGHLEPASGMAGLVKAVLALKHRALPPALHFATPNPNIDFSRLNLEVVTQYRKLTKPNGKPLVAGVNSFGFGGANAHVLLQEWRPPRKARPRVANLPAPPLVLSARGAAALRDLSGRYAALVRGKTADDFYSLAYAAAFRREWLETRLAVWAESPEQNAERLSRYAQGEVVADVIIEEALPEPGSVAFVYSGNGAQWLGMGRRLLNEAPRIAQIIAALDAVMQPVAGFSIMAELNADEATARLDDTTIAQPLLFAIQVAVTTWMREQGVEPRAVTGHSVGEVAAAWAAGALDLDQAVRVIVARSQAQGLTRGTGRMAAVGLSETAMKAVLADLGVEAEIAGINGPGNITVSGDLATLEQVGSHLESKGVFFRLLDLDYAFHSAKMDPIEGWLAQSLADLAPRSAGATTFVSTVTGDVLDGSALTSEYWWRNVRQPVLFAQATQKLAALGCRVFIEIGPHAILQRYLNENLDAAGIRGRVLPTLRRGDDGLNRLREAVLRAHLLTEPASLKSFFPYPGRFIRLPNYPWQRERHWHPRSSESLLAIERRRMHPLLGWRLPEAEAAWENTLDASVLPWLADHQVGGAMVYPAAAYAEMALAAARQWIGGDGEHLAIEQLDIVAPLVFDGEHARTLRFVLHPRDGSFQIKSRQRLSHDEWTFHAAGRLMQPAGRRPSVGIDAPGPGATAIDRETHYRLAHELGLDYGPTFQGLAQVRIEGERLEAVLERPADLCAEGYLLHPALLDVGFQSLIDALADHVTSEHKGAMLPVKIGRLDRYDATPPTTLRAHWRRRSARSVLADFELLDDAGNLVARASGCRFRAAPLKRHAQQAVAHWRIVPWLKPHPAEGLTTDLPPTPDLLAEMRRVLAAVEDDRRRWFKETLPLMEALALSFAYSGVQRLAEQHPDHWPQRLVATPLGRWLADWLGKEGLLRQEAEPWSIAPAADLPAPEEIWQTLLRDSPDGLPHLTWIGRVGQQLPALLAGELEGQSLAHELRASPLAETLYHDDPAYFGTRLALEGLLRHLAGQWPASHRLRVLEIAAGPSELPQTLISALAEDRLDYVLAVTHDTTRARLQAEYQEHAQVVVTAFDAAGWTLATDPRLPEAFDLVILRHSAHRAASPRAALAQTRRWLAAGGMLLLAERHPDWSADLLEGIDPAWWHDMPEGPCPGSSLLPPKAWQQALIDEGFADIEIGFEPVAEGVAEGAYLLFARRPAEAVAALPSPPVATWQVWVDDASRRVAEALRVHLESQGQAVHVSTQPDAVEACDHVVSLLGWQDTPELAAGTLARLLRAVQRLAERPGKAPRLWLVTRGGALAGVPIMGHTPNPAQAALWGFARVVMNEYPQLGLTLIDLACDPADRRLPTRLENELLRPDGANEIVLSHEARHVLVMQEEQAPTAQAAAPDTRFRLDFHVPGQLRNLVWLPDSVRPLKDDEIEVHVKATGLNFRDVMYLMGLLPDEAVEKGFAGASLGLEFSGVVSRVGPRVKGLLPGDPVMGFGSACFASHVITRADAVAPLPQGWSFEAAATVPTVFFTVYYALKHLADLQPGERVLIHGAAGGVGIAAIQLALHLGAEIFATAGSDEKRDFVRLLGADHVFDSRSLDFADDILAATQGEGVDVVLNSLAGEAMRRSLNVLKPFGRFLELGKRDFFENTPVGLRPFKDNISYFGIDADQLLTSRPQLAARLFRNVMALFREGALSPLPYRTFRADRIVDAFRVMQQARHVGKIVVTLADARPCVEQPAQHPAEIRFAKESTWLVTGGLSGFGLESARWLAARGVGHLVLVGRRGPDTPGVQEIIEAFAAQGVNVLAQACDIGEPTAVATLIERIQKTLPPLRGVLHAAAIFDDRLLANLDAESLEKVLRAKLLGAWHLHQATLDIPLEHFVLYSSVTTAIGNPGQANYVAANAGLEALAALRRQMGLPATCIAWGPIADAGYLARHEAVKDSLEQRLGRAPIAAAEALAQLDAALADPTGFRMPANFDWGVLARLLPSAASTRFVVLNRHRQDHGPTGESLDIRALIAGKTMEEITALVRDLVVQEVAQVLCIGPERIEADRSLHDLGMDSLMAVELALGLEQRFGIQLPVMMLNDAPTAEKVAARIVEKLTGDPEAQVQPAIGAVAAIAQQHGEAITPEEMQSLNEAARRLAQQGTRLIP